jgi:ribosome-binding protein aMBF1 (putative translation factor)
LDLHLGWEQLQQIVDPTAAQKAKHKSREFNVRYGAAIRKIREEKGLDITAIPDLSDKQLRRIERGECRLTSNSAKKLARAHGMTPNKYLQTVAAALQ